MFSEDIDPFQPSENRITLNDNVVVQFCAHVFHTLRTVLFQAIILAANSPAANRFIFSRLFFYKKKNQPLIGWQFWWATKQHNMYVWHNDIL